MRDDKYTVHPVEDSGNIFYCLYEEATEQAIDFFFFQEDADNCKKFMENGGAFHGFTPRFMLIEVNVPVKNKDLNNAFIETFTD